MAHQPVGKVLHALGRALVATLALVLVTSSVLPLLESDEWWVRLFDFLRIQIAVMLGVTLTAYALVRRSGPLHRWEHALAASAGVALVSQLVTLVPYTRFHPREMSDSEAVGSTNRVSLFIFNVLSGNRDVPAVRALIRDADPDIILLSEPNQWWLDQLSGLEADYPYTLFQPQENHYGKLLYSRLELEEPEIRFLIEPGIPSVRTRVRLRSGHVMTLLGVHPRPPGLKEAGGKQGSNEREDSDVRDAELLSVAQEVEELGSVPVVVAGDFNDVPWSHTTGLFQRLSGLLDPRVGRGFMNTFDAGTPLLRYPLDQLFASRHFQLVEMRRLSNAGSDHFAVLVVLDYDPDASGQHEAPRPEPGDRQAADKAVDKGKVDDER